MPGFTLIRVDCVTCALSLSLSHHSFAHESSITSTQLILSHPLCCVCTALSFAQSQRDEALSMAIDDTTHATRDEVRRQRDHVYLAMGVITMLVRRQLRLHLSPCPQIYMLGLMCVRICSS